MRKINRIILHCTASPDTMDIGAKEIDQWHKERGWSGIGYHWVVRRNGSLEHGRPEEKTGAHVKGHNTDSIGIVWVGTDKIEPIQMSTLVNKVKELCTKYNLDKSNVLGHYELFSGKTCPNLDMNKFRNSLDDNYSAEVEYLPDGPSEDDIDSILEQLEKDIFE